MSTPTELKSGQAFGRYELLLPVAKGGMSRVWAARLRGTRGFEKLVAIKTLFADGVEKQRLEPMLLAEARLAARIQHPNVAQYLDLGERDGMLFVVMEWVDGESLTSLIRNSTRLGRIPLGVSAQIVAQACNGLHGAHELRDARNEPLGLVHCDVSPHNLMISGTGAVKLIDFGIAKATSGAPMEGQSGMVAGKLAFMAPEQARGHEVDRRADIFSLGIVLYLLTTGRHPFGVGTPLETLERIVKNAPVIPPCAADPRYPAAVERVVMRALAHRREDRFESAAEMLYELSAATDLAHEIEVGAFVQETCEQTLRERRVAIEEALNQAAARETQGETPVAFVSVPPEATAAPETLLQHVSTTAPAAADVLFSPASPLRARRAPFFAGLVAALGLALGFGYRHLQPRFSNSTPSPVSPAALFETSKAPAPRSLPSVAANPAPEAKAVQAPFAPAAEPPRSSVSAAEVTEAAASEGDSSRKARASSSKRKGVWRAPACPPGSRCTEPTRATPKPANARIVDQYGI
jgi:serine/threonine-protein kinase